MPQQCEKPPNQCILPLTAMRHQLYVNIFSLQQFFLVQANFIFCTIGSSMSVDHEGTMHLEMCYSKKTAFCTWNFLSDHLDVKKLGNFFFSLLKEELWDTAPYSNPFYQNQVGTKSKYFFKKKKIVLNVIKQYDIKHFKWPWSIEQYEILTVMVKQFLNYFFLKNMSLPDLRRFSKQSWTIFSDNEFDARVWLWM